MAKQFFRFLRGEINGFYLTKINDVVNSITEEDKAFITNFSKMVMKRSDECSDGEVPVDMATLEGIGITAGLFPPKLPLGSYSGSLKMTESHKVNNTEYSERGLFNVARDGFDFVRTSSQTYTDDINTLATNEKKSSLVDSGAQVQGYLAEGVKNINDDGTIDTSKVLSNPPANNAYSEFYGNKFLYLSEGVSVNSDIMRPVYLDLLKSMQWIRYNGQSISSLCKVIDIMCSNFVFITGISWNEGVYGILNYGIDEDYVTEHKLLKVEAMKLLIKMKFPQFVFNEVDIDVTRDSNGSVTNITF